MTKLSSKWYFCFSGLSWGRHCVTLNYMLSEIVGCAFAKSCFDWFVCVEPYHTMHTLIQTVCVHSSKCRRRFAYVVAIIRCFRWSVCVNAECCFNWFTCVDCVYAWFQHVVLYAVTLQHVVSDVSACVVGTRCILIHVSGSKNSSGAPFNHLPLDKMSAISQTMFSDAFSWMKNFTFWSKFH